MVPDAAAEASLPRARRAPGGTRPEEHRIALRIATVDDAAETELLVCRAGHALVGFPSAAVREILPAPATEPIGGAPPWVAGRVTASGARFPVLDVARRLACRRGAEEPAASVLLVVDGLGGPAGLLVHEARGRSPFDRGDLRGLSHPDEADYVVGLVERPEGLLLVLSVPGLLLASGFDGL